MGRWREGGMEGGRMGAGREGRRWLDGVWEEAGGTWHMAGVKYEKST